MKNVLCVLAAAAALALAGCNQADSPREIQEDIAKTRAADSGDADEQDASGQAGDNARETAAESSYKMAIAQAEAAHRIAMERCEALGGEQQEDCMARADNELERARRDAELRRDRTG